MAPVRAASALSMGTLHVASAGKAKEEAAAADVEARSRARKVYERMVAKVSCIFLVGCVCGWVGRGDVCELGVKRKGKGLFALHRTPEQLVLSHWRAVGAVSPHCKSLSPTQEGELGWGMWAGKDARPREASR